MNVGNVGKVYLVGAGPGHPQLLTIKARELIRRADIIIYDRLIQTETLAGARADAEQVYVGKAPGLHQSRQDEIHRVLLDSARRAKTVVRLKGGDPVLFGRGGEEAEYLASHGIPFEVVPGVTAGLSVPMAAGIPVTHRDHASSVVLVTGHRRDDREMREIDWSALARLDTLVFFMGVAKLPEIAARLIANGRSPETPAAVVQMAYWPGEQVVVGTLEDLPRLARDAEVKPPATIVVGEVVKVRERLTTFHRDLRRDSDEPVGFGLSAQGLLQSLGDTLRGAKDLLAALELKLFDELEQAITAEELADRLNLAAKSLAALLCHLSAQGLVLRDRDTFRSSEAASLYLNTTSESYLGQELKELLSRAASYDPLALLRDEASPG